MEKIRRYLLWIDGLGGLAVGVGMLLLKGWLSKLYGVPENLLLWMGIFNLIYGSYSLPLALRSRRPLKMISFLAIANMSWGVVCFVLAALHFKTSSAFGLVHFLGEGLYVGGLGWVEWRWREFLQS